MAVPMASENNDPPGEAQNQNAFFKLPAEIRNEIYAQCLYHKVDLLPPYVWQDHHERTP